MEEDKKEIQSSCGCGGGQCCKGSKKWIWIILVVAIAGILIAKNNGRINAVKTEEKTNSVVSISESLKTAAIPKLVDLGAGKCIPCKMMAPVLEDLKKTYSGKLDVVFIDVWEKPEEAGSYGIKMIPTQIFYDSAGKELFRHEGFFAKEDILAKWKELGVDLNVR